MIFCCGCYHTASEKRILFDNEKFENRIIEILEQCPKCGRKKAVFSQRRIVDGKLITKVAPKGKIKQFIEKYSKEPWEDALKPPKQGTMSDMNWFYLYGPDEVKKDFNEITQTDNIKTPVKYYLVNTKDTLICAE